MLCISNIIDGFGCGQPSSSKSKTFFINFNRCKFYLATTEELWHLNCRSARWIGGNLFWVADFAEECRTAARTDDKSARHESTMNDRGGFSRSGNNQFSCMACKIWDVSQIPQVITKNKVIFHPFSQQRIPESRIHCASLTNRQRRNVEHNIWITHIWSS